MGDTWYKRLPSGSQQGEREDHLHTRQLLGLKDADAEKLWECSVFQYDENYKFSDLAANSVSHDLIFRLT